MSPTDTSRTDDAHAKHRGRLMDDELCVALHTASRAVDAVYRRELTPWGLSYPQFLVLSMLEAHDGQRPGELARQIGVDPSSMSPLVRRLQDAGLVTRDRQDDDERAVTVRLTDRGRVVAAESRSVPDDICERTGMTADTHRQLTEQLKALTRQLLSRP